MLVYDPSTGFSVSEVSDVREQVAADWQAAFSESGKPALDTAPETPQGQVIDSQAAAIVQKDAEVAFLATQFNPKTATGIWQDALARIYFIERKGAVNSSATCTITGRVGTQIAAGALIQSSADGTQWALDEAVTIPAGGTISATFTCQTAGAISAAADTLDQIVTVTAGWDAVTNPGAAVVGRLSETQAAFEARRYDSVALNARGTEAAVYARVASCDGVISVFTVSNRTNVNQTIDGYTLTPHSIYVAVIGGDDDEIAAAIYNSLSAGCDMNGNTAVSVTDENTGAVNVISFERPADFPVYARVRVLDNGSLPDEYERLIQEAMIGNFYATEELTIGGETILRLKMGDTVYASRFLPSILNAGIASLLGVELGTDGTTWAETVHIPIDGAPSLSAENITVETMAVSP